jgi:hypothetical protein
MSFLINKSCKRQCWLLLNGTQITIVMTMAAGLIKGEIIMKRILVFVFMLFFLGTFVSTEYAAAARFVNNNDGTVTDTQTGLMWADHDNGSPIMWVDAKSYCEGYSGGGKSGWRMPNINELGQLWGSGAYGTVIRKTGISVWSLEAGPYEAYDFLDLSGRDWDRQHSGRALPVRNAR